MEAQFLTLDSDTKEWGRLRQHIASFCEQHQLPQKLALSLQLVSEEWFLNIIVHGYGKASSEVLATTTIEFSISLLGHDQIMLYFIDYAPEFDPLQQAIPDVTLPATERKIGGLGILLIQKMMDECTYRRSDGRNHFIMYKKIA